MVFFFYEYILRFYALNNSHFAGTDIVNIDSYLACIARCISLNNNYLIKVLLSYVILDGIIIEYKSPFLII